MMKNSRIILAGIGIIAVLMTACGGGKKFRPEEKRSVLSPEERERAIAEMRSSLAVDPFEMMERDGVKISVLPPEPSDNLSESQSEEIAVRMLQVISHNGIGGINNSPGFVMTGTLTGLDFALTGTAPQKTMATATINYAVVNAVTGEVYATASQKLTGAGDNRQEALQQAIASISYTSDTERMLATATERIIEWYKSNLGTLKNQVEKTMATENFPFALALLESVPSQATEASEYARKLYPTVLDRLKKAKAADELAALKSAIAMAGDEPSAQVYAHLQMLPDDSQAYKEAGRLVNEYEKRVNAATSARQKSEDLKEQVAAEREYQLELAKLEQQKIIAGYQAEATSQALRVSMSDYYMRHKGFWSGLGMRILDAIDRVSGQSNDAMNVVKENIPVKK